MLFDLRYALRRLWKNPGFTIAAVLTLGLAIGASTATFSAVNAVLLRPLPYPNADRLVLLWGEDRKHGDTRSQVCYPDVEAWRQQSHTLEDAAAYTGYWTPALAGPEGAEQLNGMRVSDSFFHVMGANAALGRTFEPEDMWGGRGAIIVISHGLWERRFAKDPSAVGSKIRMNGRAYTIVGVLASDAASLPESLLDHGAADVYTPLSKSQSDDTRNGHHLRAIARLKPGVTLADAQQELDVVARRLEAQFPDTNTDQRVGVVGLRADMVRDLRPALLILQGAVLVVVLLGCANVANLLLAQFTARRKDLAIRGALGAGRARLVRQLLAECLVLAALAGCCGLLIAEWSLPLIEFLGSKALPNLTRLSLDWRVAAFSAGVSLLSALIFGLAPAIIVSMTTLSDALKSGGRGMAGVAGGRLRSLLVVAEMAGALALLVCAALLVGSFIRLRGVSPGFDPRNVIVAEISLPGATYPESPARQLLFTRLLEKLGATPGVAAAGAVSVLPESSDFNRMTMDIEGRVYGRNETPSADQYGVTAGYFRTFAIPLLQGRLFSTADDMQHTKVAIVNETAARTLWPGENPVGRRVRTGGDNEPWRTIVGVVGDVYQYGLDSKKTMQIYLPHSQDSSWAMNVLIRGTGDPARLAPAVRAAMNEIDPEIPAPTLLMEDVVADSIAGRRFSMTVMAAFGLCAVLLAAIGIYGVISYSVAQRTAEFGIRLALGAETRHILGLVIGRESRWIALGLLAGLGGGLALARYMGSLLFGVSPRDPATYLCASLFLAAVAVLAGYVPARRAARVDPIVALRAM
jgi:predicted permease